MSSGLSQGNHSPQLGKSISNAKTFQAGHGNPFDMVAKPVISSAAKMASAAYSARQGVLKARKQAAESQLEEQPRVHEELAPTKVMPVSNRSAGSAMRATIQANNLRRNLASIREESARSGSGYVPAGAPAKPTSLEQVPHYAVGQAMRPQRQQEIHRALSSLQYKNQD